MSLIKHKIVLLLAIHFNERRGSGKSHMRENAVTGFLKNTGINIVHM